jgi:hypothetical protein
VLPLIRGAWLGKPSKRKPFKRRFFQLSADGASLRWWARRLHELSGCCCNSALSEHTMLYHVSPMPPWGMLCIGRAE